MAQTIVMPRFGATMEEGTVNAWSVREGDVVAPGDVLGDISIEKHRLLPAYSRGWFLALHRSIPKLVFGAVRPVGDPDLSGIVA